MVESGMHAVKFPGVHGDVELFDLLPPASSGWCGPKPGHVTEVEKRGWMHLAQ